MKFEKYLINEKKFDSSMSHDEQIHYLMKGNNVFVMKKDYSSKFKQPKNGTFKKGDKVKVSGNKRGGTENFEVQSMKGFSMKGFTILSDYGKPFDFINKFTV